MLTKIFLSSFISAAIGVGIGYQLANARANEARQLTAINASLDRISQQLISSSNVLLATPTATETTEQTTDGHDKTLRSEMAAIVHRAVEDLLKNELRTEVVAALQQIQRESGNIHVAVTTESPEKEIQKQQSIEQANHILSAAVDRGRWEQTDAKAFHEALHNLSGNELVDVQRRLAVAINNGTVVLEPDALP